MQIKLLLGNKINDNYASIIGYGYDLDGKEVQIMSVLFEDTLLKKVADGYNSATESKEPTDGDLEFLEEYNNADNPLDFGVTYYNLAKLEDGVYAKLVNQVVPYKSSTSLVSSKALLRKIERNDSLYYDFNNKIISKNFRSE